MAVDSDGVDLSHAVQVADRIWWVGHMAPGSDLNCHTYLIEQGEQSVLLDPGSRVTFEHTLQKIEAIIPFSHIRWFICHHPDPDVTASLPLIDAMTDRKDARIVTHPRAGALIRHYGISIPFWQVEEHQWRLQLPDRLLQFVFTPYAHFPAAFCTFDEHSGTLFSSNLFGGFNQGQGLFAQNENYFESIRIFHEHYMPSRDVLGHALSHIEKYPVRVIAPQHGAIIPEQLAGYVINKLKGVECGLYLVAGEIADIQRLSRLNGLLKDITSTMIVSRDFRDIAERLLLVLQQMLPATLLEFFVQLEDETVLHLAPASRYRGVVVSPPQQISSLFGIHRQRWNASAGGYSFELLWTSQEENGSGSHWLVLPLFKREEDSIYGVAVIHLEQWIERTEEIERVSSEMCSALQVAVERETIYRGIELERQRFYERSIRDSLTGLFTRFYMEDTLRRLFEIHDRNGGTQVALAMLDIDYFKRLNDSYGHVQGDDVLRQVAQIIRADARAGDIPVRLGGEEFGIFVVGAPAADIPAIAERLRRRVAGIRFKGSLSQLKVTVSVGTAIRQQGESIPGFIERADLALYMAKKRGRNQVCFAGRTGGSGQWSLSF